LSSLFRCSRSLTLALDSCAFRQIWALPNESGLKPTYYTRHFTDDEKKAGLVRVVAPVGGKGVSEEREVAGPAPVRLPLSPPILTLQQSQKLTLLCVFESGPRRFAPVRHDPRSRPVSLPLVPAATQGRQTPKGLRPRRSSSPPLSPSLSSLPLTMKTKKTALTLSCWLASRQIQTSGYNTSPAYPASKGARINVNDELDLGEGDGLFVEGGQPGRQMGLVNTGDKNAEVLVFDLGE
jgi:hypothetical protein